MHRRLKGKLVIGLAALAVAAFAGGAYAATESSVSNSRQAFLNDVAKRLHVTPQELAQALSGATIDQLQAAVKAGRLTQAQADALEQQFKQGPGVPFGFFGPGFAPPLRGLVAPRGFGPGFGLGLAAGPGGLSAAAAYLGLTDAQLGRQLAGGKSLAQVASARGKSVSGLEQAMTAPVKARLDKLVTDKTITAAQEQSILKRFSARLAQQVTQTGPFWSRIVPWLRLRPSGPGAQDLPGAPDLPGVPNPRGGSNLPGAPNLPAPLEPALPLPYGPPAPTA